MILKSLLLTLILTSTFGIRPATAQELYAGLSKGMSVEEVRTLRGALKRFEKTDYAKVAFPDVEHFQSSKTRAFGFPATYQYTFLEGRLIRVKINWKMSKTGAEAVTPLLEENLQSWAGRPDMTFDRRFGIKFLWFQDRLEIGYVPLGLQSASLLFHHTEDITPLPSMLRARFSEYPLTIAQVNALPVVEQRTKRDSILKTIEEYYLQDRADTVGTSCIEELHTGEAENLTPDLALQRALSKGMKRNGGRQPFASVLYNVVHVNCMLSHAGDDMRRWVLEKRLIELLDNGARQLAPKN